MDKLISSVRQLAATQGLSACSARAIAAMAQASPSAIHYHFGSLERLFEIAFDGETKALDHQLELLLLDLSDLPPGPYSAEIGLRHVIRAWIGHRDRALLYSEIRCNAELNDRFGPQFSQKWGEFWWHVAKRLELPEPAATLLHLFFESEALYHLSQWRPALEEGALTELIACLTRHWVSGERSARGYPLFDTARLICHGPERNLTPEALKIADAAVGAVEDQGLGGLTHRAVALRAGVGASTVAYHFRRVEDLVAAALHGQVDRFINSRAQDLRSTERSEDFMELMLAEARRPETPKPVIARRQLFLASLRRPDLATVGATIRYVQGGTLVRPIGRIIGPRQDVGAIAAVVSRLTSALRWLQSEGTADPAMRRETLTQFIVSRIPSL